jgi:hypothetical protein
MTVTPAPGTYICRETPCHPFCWIEVGKGDGRKGEKVHGGGLMKEQSSSQDSSYSEVHNQYPACGLRPNLCLLGLSPTHQQGLTPCTHSLNAYKPKYRLMPSHFWCLTVSSVHPGDRVTLKSTMLGDLFGLFICKPCTTMIFIKAPHWILTTPTAGGWAECWDPRFPGDHDPIIDLREEKSQPGMVPVQKSEGRSELQPRDLSSRPLPSLGRQIPPSPNS